MQQPLVSIIIPTYNRAHLIGETLDSVIAQTYTNWECIVVDDGSTDNTSSLLQMYCEKDYRIQYYHRPNDRPKGANACRNYGFELSNGEFVNWFDSDDLMMPHKLDVQILKIARTNEPFVVCQTSIFTDKKENVIRLRHPKIYSKDFFNDFITDSIKWLTQSPLMKKSFIVEHNLNFDESLHQYQERDFFIRVLYKTNDYLIVEDSLVLLRKHDGNLSNSFLTPKKSKSRLKVSYNTLLNFKEKLSNKSKQYLKDATIKGIRDCAITKDYKTCYVFFNLIWIDEENFTFEEKLKIYLGILCFNFLGKGFIFFK